MDQGRMESCIVEHREPQRQEYPVTPLVLSAQTERRPGITSAGEDDLRLTETFPREDDVDATLAVGGTPLILHRLQKISSRWMLDLEIGHFTMPSIEPEVDRQNTS